MFKIYQFKKVKSTFDKAEMLDTNSVVIANKQTKGKGRFKRSWNSSSGGIYMSIVLEKLNPSYLTFIAAISAQKAIKESYGIETKIKWPNDLLFNKKKVCGILTTVKDKAIIGIGINTNNKIPKTLEKKATSLKKITDTLLNSENSKGLGNSKNFQSPINNKKIINKLLKHFEKYLKLLKNKKYPKIIKDWKKLSFLGQKVKVKTLKGTFEGIAYNIDKDCFLIVKTKTKKIKVIEGDVFLG
jgi:BirA family transcriptional regulator, biotin operon repressor / biotin---[acetyl-CoA-carboxylase] ligase